jgi:hypothetical protein
VSWWGIVLVGVLGLAGAAPRTQRPPLPFGLRAGRHDVGVRPSGRSRGESLWYPARCGRHSAAPATPCRDAPPDSGRFPLLVLVWTDRAATRADTATAEYFASHGYVVAATSDAALDMTRALPFVDAARIARVELRPHGALLRVKTAGQVLVVDVPPGPSDHVRVSAAVTHAFLAAMLRDGFSLSDLTRRLRAAGLEVRITDAPRQGTGSVIQQ